MPLTKSETKYLRSLSLKKVREREQTFLLEGWRPLREALAAHAQIELVLCEHTAADSGERQQMLEELRKRSIPLKHLARRELDRISNTVHSQGILAVVRQKNDHLESVLSRKPSLIVAADGVSDPGNLGSIVRTCDWFGADALLLGKGCVELYNEKVLRSTAGSMFHLSILEEVNLLAAFELLRKSGFAVIALSGDGEQSYLEKPPRLPCVLIVGNEAHGIRPEVRSAADVVLSIPRYGSAESLNVGVACGIVLAAVRASNKHST